MTFSNVRKKVYYTIVDNIYNRNSISLPASFNGTKNLFLYFDYEREFGGHKTKISDKNIDELLELLHHYDIKVTWFTVGRIFKAYPESIKIIQNEGHEIASHTFNHIPPLTNSAAFLAKDFKQFSRVDNSVEGFHSPRGEWNHQLIKQLKKNKYAYDVISMNKGNKPRVTIIPSKEKQPLLRLRTIGDDWPLYNRHYSTEKVNNYFKSRIELLGQGELAGMGFHPWVLFSDHEIYKGFRLFIDELSQNKVYRLEPTISFVNEIKTF